MGNGPAGTPGAAVAWPVVVEYKLARVLAPILPLQWVEWIAKDIVLSPNFAAPMDVQVLCVWMTYLNQSSKQTSKWQDRSVTRFLFNSFFYIYVSQWWLVELGILG